MFTLPTDVQHTFVGTVWRYVPSGTHALDLGAILRAAGRWNRRHEYGCLYTALTRDGALAEYAKIIRRYGPRGARDLVTIDVRVTPVLDLTDRAVRDTCGIALETLTGDRPENMEYCRTIADIARQQHVRAILVPSAAAMDCVNLMIYPDGRAGNLELSQGQRREHIAL